MRPGITVRPWRSTTRGAGPAILRMYAELPTARIFPSYMASASRTEKRSSTVRILPLTRIVSGVCAQALPVRMHRAKIAANRLLILAIVLQEIGARPVVYLFHCLRPEGLGTVDQ